MDHHASPIATSVSNLVPTWNELGESGGSYEPASASRVVERAVEEVPGPVAAPRRVMAPERVELAELLAGEPHDDELLPHVDYDQLRRRDIARELLRARLVAIAEQREHRSAYEIVFIMLAAAVAVLLAAPPLVQVLLAAHGIQG